jgi:hypothetical protein
VPETNEPYRRVRPETSKSALRRLVPLLGAAALAQADWIDARMQEASDGRWASLWTCDSLESSQHRLASIRESVAAVSDSGRMLKSRCTRSDPTSTDCPALGALHDSVARLRSEEGFLRSEVGRLASGCPADGWNRLVAFRAMERSRDSACALSLDTGCGRLQADIANVAWIPEWQADLERRHREQSPAAGAFPRGLAALERAMATSAASGQDTLRARCALLRHRSGRIDSARSLFLEILERHPNSAWVPVAHMYLGSFASPSPETGELHLKEARKDPGLAPSALATLADLAQAQDRPLEAADTLVSLLGTSPGLADSAHLFRLAKLVQLGGMDPDSFQARLSKRPDSTLPPSLPPWADTLYLIQSRLELRRNFRRGLEMLADFQVRFPATSLSASARETLARARRRDPRLLGP